MDTVYKPHPLAELFPPMSDAEYQALLNDIKVNGLREPITIYEGKILDGRHRYRACMEANVPPKFREVKLSPDDAAALSVARNLQRRHLSKSQQAMYLVKAGLVKAEPAASNKRVYRRGDSAIRSVSARYGVSHVSVYKAIFVAEHDDDLAERVLHGDISVAKAERLIRSDGSDGEGEIRDHADRRVPRRLQGLFQLSEAIATACEGLAHVLERLAALRQFAGIDADRTSQRLQEVMRDLNALRVEFICPRCAGKGCPSCGGRGWLATAGRHEGK